VGGASSNHTVSAPSVGAGAVGGVQAVTVRTPDRVATYVPLMVTFVSTETLRVVETVKFEAVVPTGTVTFAGTVATVVLELFRVTTAPPVGALLLRVAVPVLLAPQHAEALRGLGAIWIDAGTSDASGRPVVVSRVPAMEGLVEEGKEVMQEDGPGAVIDAVAHHRANYAEIVGAGANVGEQIANRNSALTVLLVRPEWFHQAAHGILTEGQPALERNRLAVVLLQPGLGIEGVDAGRAAVH